MCTDQSFLSAPIIKKKINTQQKKNEQNKQKGLVWLILENYQILTYFMFYAIIYFSVIKAL